MPIFRHHRPRITGLGLAAAVAGVSISACGSTAAIVIPRTVRIADVAQAATNPVTVSPLPGTGDASPTTQISFLGGPGTTGI
jgi:hypothetical protein